MSSLRPARRRAERFDAALERSSTTGLDTDLLDLVELVGALREAPRPLARPDFVLDLRSQLLAAAETELTPAAASGPTSRTTDHARTTRPRRERRLAVALGGLAIVGATTSMAVAAQSALPGELLYPVKLAIEDADTHLSAREHRGTELLDHASERLVELDQLGQASPDGFSAAQTQAAQDALATFADQAGAASDLLVADYRSSGDEQPIVDLRDFTGQSIDRLGRLEGELPPELQPALARAAQVLVDIDDQAAGLCPDCGSGIVDLPAGLTSAATPLDEATSPGEVTSADADAPSTQLDPLGEPSTQARPEAVGPSAPAVPDLGQAPAVGAGVDAGSGDTSGSTGGQVGSSTAVGANGGAAGKGAKKKADETVKKVTGAVDGAVSGLDGASGAPSAPGVGQAAQDLVGTIDQLTGQVVKPPAGR